MMKWLPVVWLSVAVAIAATPAAQPLQPLPRLTLNVTTRARALRQGEVVLVTVTPSREVTTVEAGAFAAPIGFWRSAQGLQWQGLVGIPLDADPGRREVVIRASTGDNVSAVARIPLQIARTSFAERRLTVDERFVDPPESEVDRILREAKRLETVFAATRPGRLWTGPWRMPVPGAATSSFGRQTFLNGTARGRHQGADFRAASGTPIHAPNAGEVVLAEPLYFSGNTVIIDHGDGLYSLLAHLSKTVVTVGSRVAMGDLIGEVGATGRVTGPHLHWAVRLHNVTVDPLSLVHAVAAIDGTDVAPPRAPGR